MEDALLPLTGRPFSVMDGAGNDFVIVDLRRGGRMTAAAARTLGDRQGPFGCDQVITLETRDRGAFMGIFNADGSEAGACGNAARCVADLLMQESGSDEVSFGSPSGLLAARRTDGIISVDMGRPRFASADIPLATPAPDTTHLDLDSGFLARFGLEPPAAVSMGNPHVVFFVPDVDDAALERFGPLLETDPMFPEGVNVSVGALETDGLAIRTWERGAGLTMACGTAACAALVSACRRRLTGRSASIRAPGGLLTVHWDEATDHVHLGGPVRLHRCGVFGA